MKVFSFQHMMCIFGVLALCGFIAAMPAAQMFCSVDTHRLVCYDFDIQSVRFDVDTECSPPQNSDVLLPLRCERNLSDILLSDSELPEEDEQLLTLDDYVLTEDP
jgi:hypothetical protein